MNIEIIAIGNEILSGTVVNTNAAFMSEELKKIGWQVTRHSVVSDDPLILKEELRSALNRADVVITTGGLGPTTDDLTREAAASIFNSDFHFNEEVAQDLKRRYGEKLSSLKDQATIPSKAIPLLNPLGTAPGLIFKHEGKLLIMLPGVPYEMQALFAGQVIPFLQKTFPEARNYYYEILHLCLHSENEVDPFLRHLQKTYPDLELGIYPSLGTLRVSFKSKQLESVKRAKYEFLLQYSSYIYISDSGKIEEALHQLFLSKKKTLALAESCTGGQIASSLTIWPGASTYFLGSMVVYSNELKTLWLNVSEDTLKEKGAVSPEAIKEMLSGIFEKTTADFALAVSGIAGPTGGTPEKPVGTVWGGIAERGKPFEIGTFFFTGDRKKIISLTTTRLLSLLWRKVQHEIPAFD